MRIVELASATLVLLGLTLEALQLPGVSISIVLGLSALSFIYFYLGFALFNGLRFRDIFRRSSYRNLKKPQIAMAVLSGFVLSSASLGIMFKMMRFPGATIMLITGLVGCGIAALILALARNKQVWKYYRPTLIRLGIFFIAGLVMLV